MENDGSKEADVKLCKQSKIFFVCRIKRTWTFAVNGKFMPKNIDKERKRIPAEECNFRPYSDCLDEKTKSADEMIK